MTKFDNLFVKTDNKLLYVYFPESLYKRYCHNDILIVADCVIDLSRLRPALLIIPNLQIFEHLHDEIEVFFRNGTSHFPHINSVKSVREQIKSRSIW